jgi:hypothetical protein
MRHPCCTPTACIRQPIKTMLIQNHSSSPYVLLYYTYLEPFFGVDMPLLMQTNIQFVRHVTGAGLMTHCY